MTVLGKAGVQRGEKPVGREAQFDVLHRDIARFMEFRKGGVIHVTGISGTGKSATVHAVLGSLWNSIECVLNPPALVSINCMNLMTPKSVYERIWDGCITHRCLDNPTEIIYPCQSVGKMARRKDTVKEMKKWIDDVYLSEDRWTGSKKGKRRIKGADDKEERSALIVFLDEADRLLNASNKVLIELAAMATSSCRLILIAASNAINLTDVYMSDFGAIGCLPKVIFFAAYRPNDAASIIRNMLSHSNSVLTPRAVEFMAKKACTLGKGDMRSIVRTCLSALSVFEYGDDSEAIDIKEMTNAFEQMGNKQDDGVSEMLKALPLDQQILLLSILQLVRTPNDDDQDDSDHHLKKKRKTRTRTSPNEVDLNTIYQRLP